MKNIRFFCGVATLAAFPTLLLASEPTPDEVKAAFKKTIGNQIEASRVGLPVGSNVTLGDLEIAASKCYKSFQSVESPEDYMCAVAWTFEDATKVPVDAIRVWKNEMGNWTGKKLGFEERDKVFKTVDWPVN